MRKIKKWGYTFMENGDIYGLYGKKITTKDKIAITIDGHIYKRTRGRLIYYVFNQDTFDINDMHLVVAKKDTNKGCELSNLFVLDKVEAANRNMTKKLEITEKQIKSIIREYNRGKVRDMYRDKNDPNKSFSLRKTAEKYGVSHSTISKIIKEYGG